MPLRSGLGSNDSNSNRLEFYLQPLHMYGTDVNHSLSDESNIPIRLWIMSMPTTLWVWYWTCHYSGLEPWYNCLWMPTRSYHWYKIPNIHHLRSVDISMYLPSFLRSIDNLPSANYSWSCKRILRLPSRNYHRRSEPTICSLQPKYPALWVPQ